MHWESQKIKLKIKKSSRKIQSLENVSKATKLIQKLLAKPELYIVFWTMVSFLHNFIANSFLKMEFFTLWNLPVGISDLNGELSISEVNVFYLNPHKNLKMKILG